MERQSRSTLRSLEGKRRGVHNTADLGVRGINHSSHLSHISLESPFWTVPGGSLTYQSSSIDVCWKGVGHRRDSYGIPSDRDGLQWMSVKGGDEYNAPSQPLHQRHAE